MEVTEVRVKLMGNRNDKLKAFCSITFDNAFVVRDLKIIEGLKGIFVAMPSRKLSDKCPRCSTKNHLRANYCNECGLKLSERRRNLPSSAKLHADIAHPINSECRQNIQTKILEAYKAEVKRVYGEDITIDRISSAEDEGFSSYEVDETDSALENEEKKEFEEAEASQGEKEKTQDGFNAGIFG
ncbi:MAG: stage V sporulation protein G [Planctomycetota bacterium]|nr:MAG: stage V sporulation protein G [Planctomycetota bacterium]